MISPNNFVDGLKVFDVNSFMEDFGYKQTKKLDIF